MSASHKGTNKAKHTGIILGTASAFAVLMCSYDRTGFDKNKVGFSALLGETSAAPTTSSHKGM